ncbi:MAG TPA: hypothetical protein VJM32_01215 [Candidatus Saccharimonadales bacterium]|nr:hypothetical protein [Candidatus Saccharimonadales bacterium]
MYIPMPPDGALRSAPDDVTYPCTPADMRIFKTRPSGNNSAWDGHGSEIVWRLMVAARLRGEWVAVDAAKLLAEILVEGTRAEGQRLAYGYFYVRNDMPDMSVRFFRDALANLVKYGFIGRAGDWIWLLPFAVERCQVPVSWSEDNVLQF